MILGQKDPKQRRISFSVTDLSGNLVEGLGSAWSGTELQRSVNGAAPGAAPGSVVEIGAGAYYYQATDVDASVQGNFILIAAKTGYKVTVADEPVNRLGYSYVSQYETKDVWRRVYYVLYDGSGVATPGQTPPAGIEQKTSLDGSAMNLAGGTSFEVGLGVYGYQMVDSDVVVVGDLLVRINKSGFQAVIARRPIVANGLTPFNQVTTSSSFVDKTVIGGSDIALSGVTRDFVITMDGDWALVSGVAAAQQSIVREIPAPKGSLPRRPTWGGGIAALLFKGSTKATRDLAVAQARAVALANPRIRKLNNVTCDANDNGDGILLRVDADSVDGPMTAQVPVQPKGNGR